ncbi:MAG: hypothetical protein IT435_01885 [Phycisphaerales bacterium]|nr:hypothetical protein [Phycisphaerales bacterium]
MKVGGVGGGEPLGLKLGIMGIELAILGVAWWLLKLDWLLVVVLCGLIVIVGLAPGRLGSLLSGIGMLIVAGLMYWRFGSPQLAALLGIAGLVVMGVGIARLKGMGRRTE